MTSPTPSPRHARYVLGLLAAINVLNFIDRQVIFILFEPVKRDLGLTDTALGLLGGFGFAIFFAMMSLPLGRLADTWSRRRLIGLGVGAWSAMTALSGFAQNFTQLFLARMGVGIGEASFGPAALAMISDLFPPRRRASVMAVFASGVPIGAGLGLLIGGFVAARYGWRFAFWMLGAPGLLLAILAWRLREPRRGHAEGFDLRVGFPDPGRLREIFLRTPTLRYHVLGVSCIVFAIAGFSAWVPSFLQRHHAVSIREAGALSGAVFATAGLVGVLLGGWLADALAGRRTDGRMRLILYGALAAAPLTVGTLYLSARGPFLACFWLNTAISSMWFSPATATVHDCVEPRHRGTAVAVYLALINILGFALGPLAVGAASDLSGDLRQAMLLCPLAGLAGAAILRVGARHVDADRARALARAAGI